MIFPDVPLKDWLLKYNFEVVKNRCIKCRRVVKTTVPFIEKNFIGLMAPDCPCGEPSSIQIFQARTKEVEEKCNSIYNSLQQICTKD